MARDFHDFNTPKDNPKIQAGVTLFIKGIICIPQEQLETETDYNGKVVNSYLNYNFFLRTIYISIRVLKTSYL